MDIVARTNRQALTGDSTPGRIHVAPGGVGRNVAENLARLGHATHLVSAVGDDDFGRRVRAVTQAAGVHVGALQVMPGQRTATYLAVHGVEGDLQLAVNDMALVDALTPDFLQPHLTLIQNAVCRVLDCNLAPSTLAWLMAEAGSAPIFVDGVSVLKCQRIVPWLARVHTLKLNRLEAEALSGLPAGTPMQAQHAARCLQQKGVRQVVISLGEQGVCWCDAEGVTAWLAARPVAVVNTSGAGDALLSGLVHAQVMGWLLADAVPWAMACAELTLSSPLANDPLLSVPRVQSHLAARGAAALVSFLPLTS